MTSPLGPVQVIPRGLTGFLALKQTGRLPDELLGQYQPVIELRDWFFSSRTLNEFELFPAGQPVKTLATGALQFQSFSPLVAIVPQNQAWYVFDYTVHVTKAAAADVLSYAPAINPVSGGAVELLAPVYVDLAVARVTSIAVRAGPFWAGPGDTFGMWIQDISTAGVNFTAHMRATPLPI